MSIKKKTELIIEEGSTTLKVRELENKFVELEFYEKSKGLPYNPKYDRSESFFLNSEAQKALAEYLVERS